MMKKPVYINDRGLIRCSMCSIRQGFDIYLKPSEFSEGMKEGALMASMGGNGRCIACLDCHSKKKKSELKTKAINGHVKPMYGVEYDRTFGHPKPGDELYRQLVFPQTHLNRKQK